MQTSDGLSLGNNIFDIAIWDLESSDLQGSHGRILSGAIWSLPDDEWYVFRHDEYPGTYEDDEQIALDIRDCIEEHDISVGWNIKGFDETLLGTRLGKYRNRLLRRHFCIDPMYYFRGYRGLKPVNSKLGTVAEFLDIEQKPDVKADTWIAARAGDEDAMDVVVDRNKADVRITKQIAEYTVKTGLAKNIQQYP